jgi:ribosomal protein S24E
MKKESASICEATPSEMACDRCRQDAGKKRATARAKDRESEEQAESYEMKKE